jgi:glyoxylase-like metal-dependent hydrolase (beta-lactamase superfamily II)
MKLHFLTERTGYIDNPSVIGLYKLSDETCLLIDTGLDDDAAKKVLKILSAAGLTVTHVINTHAHADHCGGNQLLQKRSEAMFLSSKGEKSYIEWTESEPHYLFGAFPPKVLRGKFLQAKSSVIHQIIGEGELFIEDQTFHIVNLPGHSPDMIGVMTPDKVFFVGDAIFDKKIVEKYGFIYNYNLGKLLESLDRLKMIEADYFVLSHGGPRLSLEEDIAANWEAFERLNNFILDQTEKPVTQNEIHKVMSMTFDIHESISTYYLNDSLLSSHLGYLVESRRLEFEVIEGEVVYKKI